MKRLLSFLLRPPEVSDKVKKQKLYKHRNHYYVKGTFVDECQNNLRIIFKESAEIDRVTGEKTATRYGSLLVAEPDNKYDENAIEVYSNDKRKIGYVPREETQYINLEFPYNCTLDVSKKGDSYIAEIYVYQKLPYKRK